MTVRRVAQLTDDEFKQMIRDAVREELDAAGLRLDDEDHKYEARADFTFLRRMRQAFNGASSKIGGAVLLALVSGLLWLVWQGVQAVIPGK